MPIYNKLVRDGIPEVIKKTTKESSILILEEEYKAENEAECEKDHIVSAESY